MSEHLLTILIFCPLLTAGVCLAIRPAWTRPVALIGALGTFVLALWAYTLFTQDTTPDLGRAWSLEGGLLDQAVDSARIEDLVVRARFRQALLEGVPAREVEALAAELAGVRLAEENLSVILGGGFDPLRQHYAEQNLLSAQREAGTLAHALLRLDREISGLRMAASGPLSEQFKFTRHSAWIPGLGVAWFVAVDGLSLLCVVLVSLLTLVCLVNLGGPGATGLRRRCVVLLLTEGGLLGVFCSLDLVLLFAFWVLLLLPGTFLVGGDADDEGAAVAARFFLPGFLGALALLLAFGLLSRASPEGTFNLLALTEHAANGTFTPRLQKIAFALLFLGCAVRLPLVPLHGWLAGAQQRAPAEFAALVQGGLLTSGAYGLLRLAWPLCPDVVVLPAVSTGIGALALTNLFVGALLLLAERDLRRMVAHASVASMGYVLLGLAAMTPGGFVGAGLEMIGHGVAAAGACLIVGAIVERTGQSDLNLLGGLVKPLPYLSGLGVLVFLSLVGIPGLASFPARLLVFLGAWQSGLPGFIPLAGLLGMAICSAALLWALSRTFFGTLSQEDYRRAPDVRGWEALATVPIAVCLVLLGLVPRLALDTLDPALDALLTLIRRSP